MDIYKFGKAHLEGFGGVAGVIEGKSEMYRHLSQMINLFL
jgi:UDP-N-acetylmuramoyl-tripeptide--D-alanyl-D-alanine ligase